MFCGAFEIKTKFCAHWAVFFLICDFENYQQITKWLLNTNQLKEFFFIIFAWR